MKRRHVTIFSCPLLFILAVFGDLLFIDISFFNKLFGFGKKKSIENIYFSTTET